MIRKGNTELRNMDKSISKSPVFKSKFAKAIKSLLTQDEIDNIINDYHV